MALSYRYHDQWRAPQFPGQLVAGNNHMGRVVKPKAGEAGEVWATGCDKIGRSMSTVSVAGGLLYVAETFGAVHCLDEATGEVYWSQKVDGRVWGSTMLADGKLYVPTSKSLLVFAAGKEPKLLATIKLDSFCLSTPSAANGVLYVATQEYLYACSTKGR